MPGFYDNLKKIESLLNKHLKIEVLNDGVITVNDHIIDTNQQLEMLSPGFFDGTGGNNPIINAYRIFFQRMGVLPQHAPSIPLIRDIPLRTKTVSNPLEQQKLFAQFLEEHVLANQWSMLFPEEYQELRNAMIKCLKNQQKPLDHKLITVDSEGTPLTSGGYLVELHPILKMQLWLRSPESLEEKDILAAVDRSLSDSVNTNVIVQSLKHKLLNKNQVAFNIRGVSKTLHSSSDIQNTDLGGGHQYFLMLDRTTKTIYAINDTRGATDEDPLAFKQQIELFLQSLGDHTKYQFEFIQGKSRQPESESYLRQICNISQFCHYAAILSGTKVHELQDTVPPKISTLMYLLQYAFVNQDIELFGTLNELINKLNIELETQSQLTHTPKQEPHPLPQETRTNNILSKDKKNEFESNPEHLDTNKKIRLIKKHFEEHKGLLNVIDRLERGSKSFNPYWMNSSRKLNRILDCLMQALKEDSDVGALLSNPKSDLSQAINMRRLPSFSFFGLCQENPVVKSREIINRNEKREKFSL